MIRFSLFFCAALLVFGIARTDRYFFKLNGSFCPNFIYSTLPPNPEWDTPIEQNVQSILDQPYTFLTKGKQSFVFASRDGKYILKFYRFPSPLRPLSFWMRPFKRLSPKSAAYVHSNLSSFKFAYDHLRKQSGLICAHLNQTKGLCPSVELIDELGTMHRIALDEVTFLIQRRGALFFTEFDPLVFNEPAAKQVIANTLKLFKDCWEAGFIDRDPILDKNFGLIDKQPFIIDLGQWERCDDLPPLDVYLHQMAASLERKLQNEAPHLHRFFLKTIQSLLTNSSKQL